MENATDALKIAFAVMVFVMALSVAMGIFTQLNEVSKVVINSSDITQFYEYNLATPQKNRTVGMETIIPTLYKYYKENYTVLFMEKNGTHPLGLYTSTIDPSKWAKDSNNAVKTGIIGKYYSTTHPENFDTQKVCSFDVDEEKDRNEPWLGDTSDFKKNLDAFIFGGTFANPNGSGDNITYSGFINTYNTARFKETLGEYTYDISSEDNGKESTNELLKNRKKRVIVYQLQ